MAEPIPPSTSGDLDPDPRSLDIPDGLTFGVAPGSWRLALSPNKQFVFLLTRTPSGINSVCLDAGGARKLAAALVECAELATGANTPASELLIPKLDVSKLELPGNGHGG